MNNKIIYQWDLDAILEDQSLDFLYDKWLETSKLLMDLYPNFYKTNNNFKKWLEIENKFEILNNRLTNYISNNKNENLNDPIWDAWIQKWSNDSIKFNELMSNYDNVVLKNIDTIISYINSDPELYKYKRLFEKFIKLKPHILNDDESLLFTKISRCFSGFDDIFSNLVDNDFKFGFVLDKNKKKHVINTISDIFVNLKSHDRVLRKNSFYAFYKVFDQFKKTLTLTLYYNYLMLNDNAKAHNFKDYIHSVCFDDEIDPSFIDHVYSNVKKYKNDINEFYKLRNKNLKRIFKLEKLYPWDKSLELGINNQKYSIEEAQDITIKALSILGDDYIKQLQKIFNERWISWLPKPGKQTGAYSIGGTRGLKKFYISMNFDNTLDSVSTLVHELGHSMHSYMFNKTQDLYCSCSIFYAEIASIMNELLLNHYLINNTNDDNLKLMLYDELITGFINTTSRQVCFSHFEKIANDWVNTGLPFTFENIQTTYNELLTQYLGSKKINLDKKDDPYIYSLLTPLRISHFYVGNFYVYKYAIGQVGALIAFDNIINNNKDAINNYYKFLESGSSLEPLETIKLLGFDLSSNEPWDKSVLILRKWINEYKKLTNKLNKK